MAVFSGNGSATAPSFTFSSDTNLGIYRGGTDILSFTTAGSERANIDASGTLNIGGTNIQLNANGRASFAGTVDISSALVGPGALGVDRGIDDNSAALFVENSTGVVSRLNCDGSASLAGDVQAGPDYDNARIRTGELDGTAPANIYVNGVSTTTNQTALQFDRWTAVSGTQSTPFRVTWDGSAYFAGDMEIGGTTASPNISLNEDGSADFQGVVNTYDSVQLIGTGKSITYYTNGTNDNTGPPVQLIRGVSSVVLRYSVMPTGTVNIGNTGISDGNFSSGAQNIHLNTNGTALKLGGGNWGSISDERAKEAIVDYTSGLEEVKQLLPRSYRFIGNDKTYIGLVAQETEGVMPEMVTQGEGMLPDGTEVDDFRTLDSTALTFALVNAVKEMSAEIDSLKARLDAAGV